MDIGDPHDVATRFKQLQAEGADFAALLNGMRGAVERAFGLLFTTVNGDLVEAEVPVTPALHQPYGLVHGGVYAVIAETLASAATAMHAMPRGQTTVGLENTTSFLRGVRDGVLRARATPLHRGRRTHVWEVAIRDGADKLVATSRVRMLCMDPGAAIAGEAVALKVGEPTDKGSPSDAE